MIHYYFLTLKGTIKLKMSFILLSSLNFLHFQQKLVIQSNEKCQWKVISWWKSIMTGKNPSWKNYVGLRKVAEIIPILRSGNMGRKIRQSKRSPQDPIRNVNAPNALPHLSQGANSTCTSLKIMTNWRLRWPTYYKSLLWILIGQRFKYNI